MAAVGLPPSEPAGQDFLEVHADHIEQGHGVGQIPALATVVLADGSPFQPQFLQVFRQTFDHGSDDRINGWGAGQMGFLSGLGSALGNKKPPRWAVCGGGTDGGFRGLCGMRLLDGLGG